MRLSTAVYLAHGPGRTISTSSLLLPSDKDTLISVDTTAAVVILDLPANPLTNDTYYLTDKSGTWSARNVILSSNRYFGQTDSYVIDVSGGVVSVTYRGSSVGWTVGLDAPMIDNSVVNQLLANKADLGSPNLTGTPTAPTGIQAQSTTQIANQAYVNTAVSAEKVRAVNAEALLAPVNNPNFGGVPTTTIPTAIDNSGRIAPTSWTKARLAELGSKVASTLSTLPVLTAATALTTASEGTIILLDSTAGAFTVSLPSVPNVDGVYTFVDVTSSWGINPVKLTLPGKFHGAVHDFFILDVANSCVSLKYTGATYGWIQL
jgi:hypothetical protein